MNSDFDRPDFDILIIGGGLVGACCAAVLAAEPELRSLRIALLEGRPPSMPPPDDEVDLRVSAISRASQKILEQVGAWRRLPPSHRSAYEDMVVWDATGRPAGTGSIRFSAADVGQPDLGHIVENRRLLWALYEAEPLRERVVVLRGSLAELQLDAAVARVNLADGRQLTARLVIGADGADSLSRKQAGIETQGWSYGQQAIVAHIHTERPHRHTAWQRFLPEGPLAFLPLVDGRCSIVWSMSPESAQKWLAAASNEFERELTQAGAEVLGATRLDSPRLAFPLRLLHAKEYCRERFVLIGDAAHAVHPLAGQGVNLGFLDCASLAEVLAKAYRAGASADGLAERRVLRKYERWRKSENLLAMGLLDGLKRLFGSDSEFASQARRAGLTALQRSPPAKRLLVQRALGLAGEPPFLVKKAGRRTTTG